MAVTSGVSVWTAESSGPALLAMTVGDMLDHQARERPDQEALVYAYPEIGLQLRLSYAELKRRADAIARSLIALGVGLGDKVAVLATNVPEWVLMQMACPKAGAVLVTVNTNYRREELAYLLQQADVHTLVLMREHRGNDYLAALRQIVAEAALPAFRHAILIGDGPETGTLPFDALYTLGAAVSDTALAERQSQVRSTDVSQIQFTSGTTGAPKGAMITHHGSLNNARMVADRARLGAADRFVTAMPMFHTAGNVVDQLSMLVSGGTVVKAITFEAPKMLELIAGERGTVIDAVPTMIIAMLRESQGHDLSSLKKVITGGTPIPVALMEEIKARWGAEPTIVFGMTEASPIITQTLPDDSFELRATTVGIPLPHTEVQVVDRAGLPVALGEPGEILVRGYNVTQGYYKMPAQTAAAIDADGWLHSGDLATLDAEGYVRIVGRIKDMYIRGGENVYPAEVENLLMRHPKILQATLVGVPDATMGEEGAALLQLRTGVSMTEDEAREYCRAHLSRHKCPKYFRFVEEVPLTPSGKVKKFEIRAALVETLGLR